MSTMLLGRLASGVIGLFAFAAPAVATIYSVADLGALGGVSSVGRAINASGEVAGFTDFANGQQHAVLYSRGVMHDLGTLPGGTNSAAFGINDRGDVVGESATPETINQPASSVPFLYTAGKMTQLPDLGGYPAAASDINNHGQISGTSNTVGNQTTRAFVYSAGAIIATPSLGGSQSFGNAINDAGQVVGDSDSPDGHEAFLYSNGAVTGLSALMNSYNVAVGINAFGQIAINSDQGRGPDAFLYSQGRFRDLGRRSAYGLNDLGQVTGQSYYSNNNYPSYFAALYEHGNIIDLNSLIAPSLGWQLADAYAINNRGQITGFGYINGLGHAFLLTPTQMVSEPGSWMMSTVGLGVLGMMMRRRSMRAEPI